MKYVTLIDADYTYPPKYLASMIKILEENPKIGMVCGNRLNNQPKLDVMPKAERDDKKMDQKDSYVTLEL